MNILVAYATRHGDIAGIAERIAAGLRAAGLPAEARAVGEGQDLTPYQAIVLGSAASTATYAPLSAPVTVGREAMTCSCGGFSLCANACNIVSAQRPFIPPRNLAAKRALFP